MDIKILEKFNMIYNVFESMSIYYKKLLDLSMLEKQQIIYEDIKSLANTILEKEEILNKINEEKNTVKKTIDDIKEYFGYSREEDVPFSRLISFMPEEMNDRFQKIISLLRSYTSNIKTVSVVNRKLVEDEMIFINHVIDFLRNGTGNHNIYNSDAAVVKSNNELSFLDVQL